MALSDRERAQLIAARAAAAAMVAQFDALLAREPESPAPASDTITLEAATALLGSKRRAREFIAWCEREGFEVRRVGHSVLMPRAEWDRAIEARSPKRSPRAAHTNSTSESDAESVDALLAQKRGYTLAPPTQRGPRKRAA
jgi:hypothetical protein